MSTPQVTYQDQKFIDFITSDKINITDWYDNDIDRKLFKIKPFHFKDCKGKHVFKLTYTIINEGLNCLKVSDLIKEAFKGEIYDMKCYIKDDLQYCTFHVKLEIGRDSNLNRILHSKEIFKVLQWNMLYKQERPGFDKETLLINTEEDFINFVSSKEVIITKLETFGIVDSKKLSSLEGNILLSISYTITNPLNVSFGDCIKIIDNMVSSCSFKNLDNFEDNEGSKTTFSMDITINSESGLFKLLVDGKHLDKVWEYYLKVIKIDSSAIELDPKNIQPGSVEYTGYAIHDDKSLISLLKNDNVNIKPWSFVSKINPIKCGRSKLTTEELSYYKFLKTNKKTLYLPDTLIFNFDYVLTGDNAKQTVNIVVNHPLGTIFTDAKKYSRDTSQSVISTYSVHIEIKDDSPLYTILKDQGYLEKYYPVSIFNDFLNVKINDVEDFYNFINSENVILKPWEFISEIDIRQKITLEEANYMHYLKDHGKLPSNPNKFFFNCVYYVPNELPKELLFLDESLSSFYHQEKEVTLTPTSGKQGYSLKVLIAKDSPLYNILIKEEYLTKFRPNLDWNTKR